MTGARVPAAVPHRWVRSVADVLGAGDRVMVSGQGSAGLGGLLGEANAAARRYSVALLEQEVGVPLVPTDQAARFDGARGIGPGVTGVVDAMMSGEVAPPDRPEEIWAPGAPGMLFGLLAGPAVCRYTDVGRRDRLVRRFAEHLQRIGWRGPRADLTFVGDGGSFTAPTSTTTRTLLVQAMGNAEVTIGKLGAGSLAPGSGYLLTGVDSTILAQGPCAVLTVVETAHGDADVGTARTAARIPAVSSASLQQYLDLAARRDLGRLRARQVTVRSNLPGGAFALEDQPDAFVSGGRVWSMRPGIEVAIGRLFSGPPVTAEELGEVASLDETSALSFAFELMVDGLCEPCDPSAPFV